VLLERQMHASTTADSILNHMLKNALGGPCRPPAPAGALRNVRSGLASDHSLDIARIFSEAQGIIRGVQPNS